MIKIGKKGEDMKLIHKSVVKYFIYALMIFLATSIYASNLINKLRFNNCKINKIYYVDFSTSTSRAWGIGDVRAYGKEIDFSATSLDLLNSLPSLKYIENKSIVHLDLRVVIECKDSKNNVFCIGGNHSGTYIYINRKNYKLRTNINNDINKIVNSYI